jgi:hypothetical protein
VNQKSGSIMQFNEKNNCSNFDIEKKSVFDNLPIDKQQKKVVLRKNNEFLTDSDV